MSSFNKSKSISAANKIPSAVAKVGDAVPDTVNLAGGQAFALTPQYKLTSLLLTSFVEDQFYRSKAQVVADLATAIKGVDPLFAAKAAIFARTVYGMRSITHVAAAHIAKNVKGEQWTKKFFDKVVYRVDDAAEILAAYLFLHKKPIPNSLKKGLALSLSKFDSYQLAKYKGAKDSVKLVDLFNLVHPKPNEANAEAFKKLMTGDLASTGTWESRLSAAGQKAQNETEAEELKTEAWKELLESKKIGYFALLRNLRNIMDTKDDKLVKLACELLVNEVQIKKSLVLPFRYTTAAAQIDQTTQNGRLVHKAISDAVTISLNNVPKFEGKTLIALDVSGSMMTVGYQPNNKQKQSPADIGSLFAAVIASSNNADFLTFDGSARYVGLSLSDSLLTNVERIRRTFTGGSTNFSSIFQTANARYERIIILSDMQGWGGLNRPQASFVEYCKKYQVNPHIYSFDLQGYGSSQLPTDGGKIYQLSGFSDKTLDLMQVLEQSPKALIDTINAIEL
jgi:hypothetical protein